MLLLQIRSWNKSDLPGHLDISVSGHAKSLESPLQTALHEMN